ncbi:MAG: hypothetical protein CMP23_10720 [Rickettsiales bacterium]|nr:hypothetical protein [Rickettsiales bacterium]
MIQPGIPLGPLAIAELLDARADDDELAAAAYELFGRSVFPFAGVFCDPQVSSWGSLAEALRQPQLPVSELVLWLPPFCNALLDHSSPLAEAVVCGLEGLVAESLSSTPMGDAAGFALSPAAALPDLTRTSTSLKAIVAWLVTPSSSGIFLSIGVLEELARSLEVPRGFGGRRRVLSGLFEAAARFGLVPQLLDALRFRVERHRLGLERRPWSLSELQPAVSPWAERLDASSRLLDQLAQHLPAAVSAQHPRAGGPC